MIQHEQVDPNMMIMHPDSSHTMYNDGGPPVTSVVVPGADDAASSSLDGSIWHSHNDGLGSETGSRRHHGGVDPKSSSSSSSSSSRRRKHPSSSNSISSSRRKRGSTSTIDYTGRVTPSERRVSRDRSTRSSRSNRSRSK